jgi:prepilin-type processing-associated H-X9-DG protein
MGSSKAPTAFTAQTVSYAGMWWKSVVTATGGAIRDDFPPNEPMASDDTEPTINHGERTNGGMALLFFDSHVEFKTNTELDIERAVGSGFPTKPASGVNILWRLKN